MAGRLQDIPDTYDKAKFQAFSKDVEARLAEVSKAVGRYEVSNFTRSTSLDMATATATDIGNFLCTLVQDLQKAGKLGG